MTQISFLISMLYLGEIKYDEYKKRKNTYMILITLYLYNIIKIISFADS